MNVLKSSLNCELQAICYTYWQALFVGSRKVECGNIARNCALTVLAYSGEMNSYPIHTVIYS
jgi:hypothetical protein